MAAYDTTYLYDRYVRPVLAFDADLPSFALIGRNFARVSEAGDEIPWRGRKTMALRGGTGRFADCRRIKTDKIPG